MKLLHAAGGVRTTLLDDRMQRAPCFLFGSAREARAFGDWLVESFDEIKAAAEATTRSGRIQEIEQCSASRMLFTRFNFATGDAAPPPLRNTRSTVPTRNRCALRSTSGLPSATTISGLRRPVGSVCLSRPRF